MDQTPELNKQDESNETFDMKKFVAAARRRWFIAAPIGIVVAGLMFASALFQTPVYSSTALVLINPTRDTVIEPSQLLTGISSDNGAIESEIEVIRSEIIAERVVDRLNLVDSPIWNSALREPSSSDQVRRAITSPMRTVYTALNNLRPDPPSASSGGGGGDVLDDRTLTERERVIRSVANRVRAQRRRLSYVIEISVSSSDPDQSAIVANAYAEAYLNSQLDARYESARRANEWLSERVDELREEVRVKESAVEAYRAETGLVEAGGTLLTDQQATELQASILNARADLNEKETRLRQIRDLLNSGASIDSVASVQSSATIAELRRQEAEIARRQTDLESRYFDQHPEVQNVRLERADIQRQIQEEVDRVVQNLENEVEIARSRLNTLQGSANQIREEVLENNRALVRLRELDRDAQAARAVLENFMARFQEIADQETLPTSEARIISRASAAGAPSSPNLRTSLITSLFLGIMVGVGIAVALELLDEVVRTTEDITERVGVPMLAVTPAVTARNLKDMPRDAKDPALFVVHKPMSAYAESLRMLRSGLTYSNLDSTPKLVAITSAAAAEGKTTMSLSLGRVSADAGQSVLLIDCDLRRQSLSEHAVSKAEYGLLDVLAGTVSLSDAIIRDEANKVDVLPTKSATFTPVDIFGTAAMSELLERVRERYDLVICDCAPVLAVAETRILARQMDACIVVARWARTQRKALKAAIRDLRQTGAPIAGVVLNSVSQYGARGEYYGSLYYSKAYHRYYADA